jgi:hypothetical protein
MLETQPKWYIPAPKILGWHIGFWNLIGALGFTLCGALGFAIDVDGVEYASTLSTFIGSWAFLVRRYPVIEEPAPQGALGHPANVTRACTDWQRNPVVRELGQIHHHSGRRVESRLESSGGWQRQRGRHPSIAACVTLDELLAGIHVNYSRLDKPLAWI